MTIVNEIILDGTPLGATEIWYEPPMTESSFIEKFRIRLNDNQSADVEVTLQSGSVYTYITDQPMARAVYDDLASEHSPGAVYSNLREYVRLYPWSPPAPRGTIVVAGPQDRLDMLAVHLQAAGFDVYPE